MDLPGLRVIDQPAVGVGTLPFASMGDLGLDKRRVTQCALSRICGVCGKSLSRPVAFVGSPEESDRAAFHFPPTHVDCAQLAVDTWGGNAASMGHPQPPAEWVVVTTSGFEFVRPTPEWEDRRPVFTPNSRLDERRVAAS